MKKIFFLTAFLAFLFNADAQKPQNKAEVVIKTTVVCGMCQTTVEEALDEIKGVRSVEVNLEAKTIKVIYNPEKISVNDLKKAIAASGYDADDYPADAAAYKQLPMCCRKDAKH